MSALLRYVLLGVVGGSWIALLEVISFRLWRPVPVRDPGWLGHLAVSELLGVAGFVLGALPFLAAYLVLEGGLRRWGSPARRSRVLPKRWFPSPGIVTFATCAAAFGYSWQLGVMQGDGIRAHAHYGWIRLAGAVFGPAVLVVFVTLLTWSRIPVRWRVVGAGLTLCLAVVVNLGVLPNYASFHGHLALFQGLLVVWLLGQVWDRPIEPGVGVSSTRVSPSPRSGGAGGAPWVHALLRCCVVLLAGSLAWVALVGGVQRGISFRFAQRYSHLTVSLLAAFPLGRPLLRDTRGGLDPGTPVNDSERDEYRAELRPWSETKAPRGRNVLLVVLESTRSDLWSNARIAKRFAKWRQQGVYFPRAVAQYPATPLAYGAMFTSQSPSVLTRSPAWVEARLFDHIADRFDRLLLTRPRVSWFDHAAITDFFVDRSRPVHKHGSTQHALNHLRRQLQSLEPSESFFAWAHFYEPHSPYKIRPRFDVAGDDDPRGRYAAHLSEVAYVDDRLGAWMDWFYGSEHAEDTLVIVVSDHGEGLGERIDGRKYWGHHVEVRNVVSHVPLFLSGPDLPRDKIHPELGVAQLDVMPTIFDFLGVELPAASLAQGKSIYGVLDPRRRKTLRSLPTEAFSIRGKELFDFVAAVRRRDPKQARRSFEQVMGDDAKYTPKVAIQRGRWKLIHDRLLETDALYDVKADPEERRDLAAARPRVLQAMRDALVTWERRQRWIASELDAVHRAAF